MSEFSHCRSQKGFLMRTICISLLMWLPAASLVTTTSGQVVPKQQPHVAAEKVAATPRISIAPPAWLEKLGLSAEQKQQIEKIVTQHDAEFDVTWQQFGSRYQDTLRAEAIVLAAIEEHLTEAQRRQVQQQRGKLLAAAATPKGTPSPDIGASKAVNPVAEESALGVALTPEQEAFGKKIQERFQQRLRALSADIQLLHNRLLSLEMDKLMQIENVLTTQQRQQLSQLRQSVAAVSEEGAANQPTSAK